MSPDALKVVADFSGEFPVNHTHDSTTPRLMIPRTSYVLSAHDRPGRYRPTMLTSRQVTALFTDLWPDRKGGQAALKPRRLYTGGVHPGSAGGF